MRISMNCQFEPMNYLNRLIGIILNSRYVCIVYHNTQKVGF